MKQKILLSFVAVILTAISAQAYDFQYGDLYYNITSDTTVEVVRESSYPSLTDVTIPDTVYTVMGDPYIVNSIREYAFQNCSGLTSVVLPGSLTSISASVFSRCSSLTSMDIPSSVTSIGNHAFYECSGLTSISIPSSVTSIGSGAFYNCSSLASITVPSSVASIGSAAFEGTAWLNS